jgi:hypothetical protein
MTMADRSAAPDADCPSQESCPALDWHRQRLAELSRQAASESLTGLWNRAHFDRMLESEIDRSRRYRQPVSLILFDIDHFKRINDTYPIFNTPPNPSIEINALRQYFPPSGTTSA